MMKHLKLLVPLALLLLGCHRDDFVENEEHSTSTSTEKIAYFERYEQQLKTNRNAQNYASLPFSQSLEAYLWKYPETEQKIEELLGEIDTKVVSEVFTDEETGKQMVFFPILKNWKVVGTLYGLVNEQKTELYFYPHTRGEERLEPIYEMFENYYSKVKTSRGIKNIEEIHLVKFRPVKGSRGSDISLTLVLDLHLNVSKSLEDTEFGGEAGVYHLPDDYSDDNIDPCQQNKNIAIDVIIKEKNDFLKTQTHKMREKGFNFDLNSDNSIVARESAKGGSRHSMSITMSNKIIGYNHTHTEEAGVVYMFSPADINSFMNILRSAKYNNLSLYKVFASLVFKDKDGRHYVYQITYNGDGSNIPEEFTKEQMDMFESSYIRNAQNYNDEDEGITRAETYQLFMDTLKEMGLDNMGIELADVSDTNNIIRIQNHNGVVMETKCNNINDIQ